MYSSMYSIYFKTPCMVHIDCMEKGFSITFNYCVNNWTYHVVKEIIKQRATSLNTNMRILHHNARAYATIEIKICLKAVRIWIIRHPEYSSVSVLSDFCLFEIDIKSKKRKIAKILWTIPREDYDPITV